MLISKESIEHWVRVESVLSYRVIPTAPVPKGVLPDPPSYRACVAWLGSSAGPIAVRSLGEAQRKALCARRLEDLKKKVVGFLILYAWLVGEVKDQGIKIPETEVVRSLQQFVRQYLPRKGDFQRYLSAAHMTEADALLVQRLTVYGEKITAEIRANHTPDDMHRAEAVFTSKWIAKTSCRPGYIFAGCHQYHGSEPPP